MCILWLLGSCPFMSFLYFRQNAGVGMEELKVEGGSISMILDVFIYCKYQTSEMWSWFDHMISVNSVYGSNPETRVSIKKTLTEDVEPWGE